MAPTTLATKASLAASDLLDTVVLLPDLPPGALSSPPEGPPASQTGAPRCYPGDEPMSDPASAGGVIRRPLMRSATTHTKCDRGPGAHGAAPAERARASS